MEDTFYKISKNVVLNNLINLKQLVFEVTDACVNIAHMLNYMKEMLVSLHPNTEICSRT